MKEFVFDRLVDKENICNLEKEKAQLFSLVKEKENVVVYAPRNYGKTSLIKNVIIPFFRESNQSPFIIFCDLMGVKSIDSIISRISISLAKEFNTKSSLTKVIDSLKDIFRSIKPTISIDAFGETSFSFDFDKGSTNTNFYSLFETIGDISKKYEVLLICDEFQDVSFVEEGEALFRDAFQKLNIPIILLGSKKHLLQNIFLGADKPLSNWGKDIVIPKIEYTTYHKYINERFRRKNLEISLEDATFLQDMMNRNPENINIVCNDILQNNKNIQISQETILISKEHVLFYREGRFQEYLKSLTESEENVLVALAKKEFTISPQSKYFVGLTDYTARTIGKTIRRLVDEGIVEKDKRGYFVSDVLLKLFLKEYR